MWRRFLSVVAVVAATTRLAAQTPTCAEPHYRWTEKTDASLAGITPKRAYISTILKTWGLLPLTGKAQYRCATRSGRELQVYSVTGWVRYLEKREDDGDWHIELTRASDSPRDSCTVAEIPPAGGQLVEGGVFVWAGGVKAPELVADSGLPTGHNGRVKVDRYLRVLDHPEIYVAGDLASVTDPRTGHVLPGAAVPPGGELTEPLRLRVIGPALFDGEHRGGPDRRDQTDGSHGHCNLSARALWEIHPVYWVKPP